MNPEVSILRKCDVDFAVLDLKNPVKTGLFGFDDA